MDAGIWLQIIGAGTGGMILKSLFDRIFRTREQKGVDLASMVRAVAESQKGAFEGTLSTVRDYCFSVIDAMKRDKEHDDARYQRLECKFDQQAADLEEYRKVVAQATNCRYLQSGDNKHCPVIQSNKQRLERKCRECVKQSADTAIIHEDKNK